MNILGCIVSLAFTNTGVTWRRGKHKCEKGKKRRWTGVEKNPEVCNTCLSPSPLPLPDHSKINTGMWCLLQMDQQQHAYSCAYLSHRCYRLHLPASQPRVRILLRAGEEITYSCSTERERVAPTLLIDRFTHLHHLAVQLHPQRCKERQMWYLASCQDLSFFLKVRHASLAALSRVLLSVTMLKHWRAPLHAEWLAGESNHLVGCCPQASFSSPPPNSQGYLWGLQTIHHVNIPSPIIR